MLEHDMAGVAPANSNSEVARLAALGRYDILDTPREKDFDDVAALASAVCGTPIAVVNLIGDGRQFFKAEVGLGVRETPLGSSFCARAILEEEFLLVPDATKDPRFDCNPLVTDEPHLRFYAGALLKTEEGHPVGTVCVLDFQPRDLSDVQQQTLRVLARQVMKQLELRRSLAARDVAMAHQERRERRLNLLAKASAALIAAADPTAVLEPILASGTQALGFDQSFIYDVDPDGRHLRLVQAVGASEEQRAALICVDLDVPLCGIVVRTGQPLILEAVQAGQEQRYAIARETRIDAFAGYPIMSRGRLVGVVSFATTHEPAFDAEALSFFATLARLMSGVRERLDADAALRASDTRSRMAQEAGHIGTFEVDVASGLVSVSPEFARLYGVPDTGVYSAERFEALVIPEDGTLPSNDGSRHDGTAALDVEYRIRRADDGALRWIARRAAFVHDEAGRVTRMFGTVQDITERRATEARLAESEARFRTILETVEAAFAIVEVKFDTNDRPVDYRFVEANPAFERQAGVNLRGKWVTEFAPDLEQFWFETYGRVAMTGEPASFENYAEAFKRWFDVRAVRVGVPSEHRIAILFNDVTARKEAEAALRASEAVARENVERVRLALAAGAIIGTWHWDIPSDRFTIDEAFAQTFGLDPALGQEGIPLAQIVATVHPDDQDGLAAAIQEAIARGDAYAHQYRVRRADGHYYWIEANGRVDHAPDGTPLSFPGVLLDIEERRVAQEKLRASEAHWRGLFERLSEGFLVGEVVRDGAGVITDWRYVDVNTAWGELVGIDTSCVAGRTIREVFPGIEDAWVHEFADVVETGQPVTFTRQVDTLRRWYEGRAFPLGPEQFGVLFLEVTARVEAETRRDALLELGDRLRDLDDVPALVQAAAEVLARIAGATRAGYGVVDAARETVDVVTDWCAPGIPSIAGQHDFRNYGSYIDDLKRGAVVAVDQVTRDPRTRDAADALLGIGIRSFLNVPILERGQLVGVAFVNYAQAHTFTEDELAFVRVVADRVQIAVARVRAEQQQRVLNEEISHRLKNSFAMVLSIAGQTLRTIPDRAPVEAFEKRVHALSSAHDVLLRQSWAAAPAKDVVKAVLANAGHADRIDVSGPEIDLGPRATLSLSLLLHELATNAAKYGALSVPAGRVAVDWHVDGEGDAREVAFDWTERGGPPASQPTGGGRKGFGSRLIGMGLAGKGGVDLRYLPSGFEATMRAPLVQLQHA